MSQPAGPLQDVRVIEFAQALAIPSCGALLADMGADVVKVEPPGGDNYRLHQRTRVRNEGRPFVICNRGKRSLCLDLTKPESRDVIDRLVAGTGLVAGADVVLASFKPDDVERYGVDYARLSAVKPDLVYLENTPYGRKGPHGHDGGYDVVVQGLSGVGAISAAPGESAPRLVRPAYADIGTGFLAALGVVAALRHRDKTGEGQRVETSLLHTALALGNNITFRFADHDAEVFDTFGERLDAVRADGGDFRAQQEAYFDHFEVDPPGNVYFRHYQTRDGFISVGCLSPRLNANFRRALELEDPRRSGEHLPGSESEAEALLVFRDEATVRFAERTTQDWIAHLSEHGVPCGRFNFPNEVFDDPQVNANGYATEIEHPKLGRYKTFTPPIRMERTPIETRKSSPVLDADTDAILGELGFSDDDVAGLRTAGVTGAHRRGR